MLSTETDFQLNALTAGCTQCSYGIYRRDATHILSVGQGSGWWKQTCCVAASQFSGRQGLMLIAQGVYPAQNNWFCLVSQSYSITVKTSRTPLNSFKVLAQTDEHKSLVWVTLLWNSWRRKSLSVQTKRFWGRHCLLQCGQCLAGWSFNKSRVGNTLPFTTSNWLWQWRVQGTGAPRLYQKPQHQWCKHTAPNIGH